MLLSNLANVCRAAGLNVVEVEGWATRGYLGRDLADVLAVFWHHTAAGRGSFSYDDAPSMNICTYGRSDLAGPLSHIVLGRSGTVYITAAGLANHAGAGSAPGIPTDMANYYAIGIEMESSGVAPYDWTPEQLGVVPVLGAALERAYLYDQPEEFRPQLGHKEYSSQGKIDPAGWPGDCDGLRASINAVLSTGGSVSLPPTVQPVQYESTLDTSRPGGYEECVVDPGDSLSKIAAEYHVGLAELLGVNPQVTDPNVIGIGDVLNLPAGAWKDEPAPAPAAPAVGGECTVSPGDSLSSIGVQVGVAWEDIASLNGIGAPYVIQPGDVLKLPVGANLAALGGSPEGAGLPPYCTVDPGDSLGSIAAQYGVSVDYILSKNTWIEDANHIEPTWRINLV